MKYNLFNIVLVICLIQVKELLGKPFEVNSKKKTSLDKAKKFLEKNILIDGHNDIASMIRKNFQNQLDQFDIYDMTKYTLNGTNGTTHTDIKRLIEGKVGGIFWSAFASCDGLGKDATRIHLDQLDVVKQIIRNHSYLLEFAVNTKEIKAAFKNKKIASMIGLEAGHAIDSSLATLRMFYDLGIRYMTLAHNCNTPWVTGHQIDRLANASAYGGLNDFGVLVIREMNRLGMMVDLAHTSHQTQLDAINYSLAPVIISHSSVYSICNNSRNVHDDVLLKLKENRGIIMINFNSVFINCDSNAVLSQAIKHIDYVVNLIGIDYVGIGSDADGVVKLTQGMDDVSKYPDLFAQLIENGWKEDDLAKLAGKNILRVFEEVENVSKSLKNVAPNNKLIPSQYLQDTIFKTCRSSF